MSLSVTGPLFTSGHWLSVGICPPAPPRVTARSSDWMLVSPVSPHDWPHWAGHRRTASAPARPAGAWSLMMKMLIKTLLSDVCYTLTNIITSNAQTECRCPSTFCCLVNISQEFLRNFRQMRSDACAPLV